MTHLDCNVISCAYNGDCSCKRGDVHVVGEEATSASGTCCDSFVCRGSGSASNSFGTPKKETQVFCDALECRFNRRNFCTADHIGISGNHAEDRRSTECASFVIG